MFRVEPNLMFRVVWVWGLLILRVFAFLKLVSSDRAARRCQDRSGVPRPLRLEVPKRKQSKAQFSFTGSRVSLSQGLGFRVDSLHLQSILVL